jgi:hypothetical protein
MPKRSSKLKDANVLAKSIMDQATGTVAPKPESEKNPAAVALGRLGGLKGGAARAKKLSAKKRSEIAKIAASARWKTKQDEDAKNVSVSRPAKKKRIGV